MKVIEEITQTLYFKFDTEDFDHVPSGQLNEAISSIKNNLQADDRITLQTMHVLFKAKHRRHPEYFNGLVIDDFNDLCVTLKNCANNVDTRYQIIYCQNGGHGIGFDVENKEGKLSIFCIETGRMEMQIRQLEKLIEYLDDESILFGMKACQSNLQRDVSNCKLYIYTILSRLAKIKTFHLQMDAAVAVAQPTFYNADAKTLFAYPSILSEIKWVELSILPQKIIMMVQSYTAMYHLLIKQGCDRQQALSRIEQHRIKYNLAVSDKAKEYYIEKKRAKIAGFFDEKLSMRLFSQKQIIQKNCSAILKLLSVKPRLPSHREDILKLILGNSNLPITVQITVISQMIKGILYYHRQIYAACITKDNPLCVEQIDDLFMLRKALQTLIKQRVISYKSIMSHPLIGQSLPILLDYKVDKHHNCFQYDLQNDTKYTDNNQIRFKIILSQYGIDFFIELTRTVFKRSISDITYYSQVIAQLTEEDFKSFTATYPNAESIRQNIAEVRKMLALIVYPHNALMESTYPGEIDDELELLDIEDYRTFEYRY